MNATATWHRFWFRRGRPEDLAICRIAFASGMFLILLPRPFHEWGDVPVFFQEPALFLRLLGVPIASPSVLLAIEGVWRVAMVTLAIGLWSRTSAAIVCLGSLYLLGIDTPEGLGRSYTPGVFVPAILAVAYCGDALSVDVWRRRRRGQLVVRPPEDYGWPATMVCVFLSYVFFAAGVAKIRASGFPGWMLSDQTSRSLLLGHYWYASRNRAFWPFGATLLRFYDGSGVALGMITQFAELLYPLALVFRAARWTIVPVMLGLLVGIATAMGPFFPLTILAHVFWVPWSNLFARFGRPDHQPVNPVAQG